MGQKASYKKGYRKELMKLLLTAGAVSYNGLKLMNGQYALYMRKLRQMEEEGIVSVSKERKLKNAKLKEFEKKSEEYIDNYPGYYGYYNRYGIVNGANIRKLDEQKKQKAYKEAELYEMMYASGVKVFPDEKEELKKGEKVRADATYYSDIELKKANSFQARVEEKEEKEEDTTIGCRALGCLFAASGYYMCYYMTDSLLRWSVSMEGQFARYVSSIVQKVGVWELSGEVRESIMFYRDINTIIELYYGDKMGCVKINNGYKHMYVIPYDSRGRDLVKKITKENWKEELKGKYLSGYNTNTTNTGMTCDGIKEGECVLLFCIPDIMRLNRFLLNASWDTGGYRYKVICYNWQKPLVEKLAEKNVTVEEVI